MKTNIATKTTTVTHLSELEADQLCKVLNENMLGARVLTAGGAAKVPAVRIRSLRELVSALADPNSKPSRMMLALQAILFVLAFLAEIAGETQISSALFAVVICLGQTLLQRAFCSLRMLRMSIHSLMFVVLLGAVCLGDFSEAGTVALVVNGSEWLLGHVNTKVEAALQRNLMRTGTHATRIADTGAKEEVPIEEIRPGDTLLLRSGEVVPTDGQVKKSDSLNVDEASVTGEALPVEKEVGTSLLSGTVVASGAGEMCCTTAAVNSFGGRMQKAVEEARSSRSRTEDLINKLAAVYTPLIVIASIIVALATARPARGLATLVGACPCALVAAAPIVQACIFVRLLSDLQVVVKHARGLEGLANMSVLGVDKTGTLTEGSFEVVDVVVLSNDSGGKDELMRSLAALESLDPHPLAHSIVKAHVGCAAEFSAGDALPLVMKFERVESKGVWGVIDGVVVGAGSAKFLEAMSVDLPREAERVCKAWEEEGRAFTAVYMTIEEDVVMVLRLEDTLRLDAAAAVARLQKAGVDVALLTGDSRLPAAAVAHRAGVSEFHSSLTPAQKERWVRSRQAGGNGFNALLDDPEDGLTAPLLGKATRASSSCTVGMLGDGLNDSPALATADVGIAVSCGLQLTINAAEVVVGAGTQVMLRFAQAVEVAKRSRQLILQNIALVAVIKLSVILLAMTGHLTLSVGILTDTGSLLLVLLNGLRPLRWRLHEAQDAKEAQEATDV
mmetsp:Transcript_84/g.183  ORF Transcript_84/g.183 Transcript_84/m.183 type:complete len:731 (-) Transcript_84:59-2251(-)